MESFSQALKNRILLFDGAMGTQIQRLNPQSIDFPNEQDGFNDGLTVTHREWIRDIHRGYLDAGADCIETNSFSSNTIKLDEYGFGHKTVSFNRNVAELAKSVCQEYTDTPRYVIGSMGPTGCLPSTNDPDLGQKPLNEIAKAFELQATGLIQGGADALLIETSQDILEVKLAIEGSLLAQKFTQRRVPIIVNTTLDPYGRMLLGTPIQAAYTTVADMGIDVFGLNCSTGPVEMTPSVKWLNAESSHPILVVPNAGMPENDNGVATYKMEPDEMASILDDFLDKFFNIRIIGGCCGTNPKHIKAMRETIDSRAK